MTKFKIYYQREFSKCIKKYEKIVNAADKFDATCKFNRNHYDCEITEVKEIAYGNSKEKK